MADMKSARREITKARRAARIQAKREFKTAPLSGVIRLAIADLEAVERSKKYYICMDAWHMPISTIEARARVYGGLNPASGAYTAYRKMDEQGASCAVCFAGAVMATRFGVNPKREVTPHEFNDAVARRLEALNSVRAGDFRTAACNMQISSEAVLRAVGRINVPAYGPKTRSRFKIQLLNAATRLEKAGL